MNEEMELLSYYLSERSATPAQLDGARSVLDEAIRSEMARSHAPEQESEHGQRDRRRSKLHRNVLIAAVMALAAAAVLILPTFSTSKAHPNITAAAKISQLADVVQRTAVLAPGQWSSLQLTGELLASVGSVGSTKTPEAKASVPVTIGVWSNSTGTTCTSQQFGTATFASPVNAQAWTSIGLIATPFGQPATGCIAGVQATTGGGSAMTPINVSQLTHDPTVLAQELQLGTTGVASVDQMGGAAEMESSSQPETEAILHRAAFARLAILIVGPTSGAWSGYHQEMLRTMALLPGVESLGRMTAHSGRSGLGFSTGSVVVLNPKTGTATAVPPSPVVLLDPETGALLEARNFSIPVLESAAQDFVGSPTAAVYANGVSYGVSTEWIDPVPGPSVVDQSALPTWISSFHSIEAIGNPNVNGQTLADVINPYLGGGNSAFDDWNSPTPSQTTFEITISNPATSVSTVVAALNSSGLCQSVLVKA
jgi:hypothetical protein